MAKPDSSGEGGVESAAWPLSVAWGALASMLWGLSTRPEWHSQAACVGHDPRWWDGGPHHGEAARTVCQGCPVRHACLSDAIAWETKTATRAAQTSGVSGAMTATERRELYRALPGTVGVPGDQRRGPRR